MKYFLSSVTVSAVFFAMSMAEPVMAQNLRSVRGPAEIPPVSFQGQQYVDSRGCVFMRAGLSGQVTWVPRIGRDRRPICNDVTASQARARLAEQVAEVTPKTMKDVPSVAVRNSQNVGQPMATIASKMTPKSQIGVHAPVVVPGLTLKMPASSAPPSKVGTATNAGQSALCPKQAPVLQRMELRTGGTVLVCTAGDGLAMGWVSPRMQGVGAAIENPPGQKVAFSGNIRPSTMPAPQGQTVKSAQVVIAGQAVHAYQSPDKTTYVAAWKDDRLNPLRGMGNAQGWAAQDQIWTRTTPAQTIPDAGQKKMSQNNQRISNSTMSRSVQGVTAVPNGARYVQVGTFGNPQNVNNVGSSLAALGLPVAKSRISKAGKDMVIVFAGPFSSTGAAQDALGKAREAGFADAFLR